MVHGDDFVAVGNERATQKLKTSLEIAYKVNCEVQRGGKDELGEIRVLNCVICSNGQASRWRPTFDTPRSS